MKMFGQVLGRVYICKYLEMWMQGPNEEACRAPEGKHTDEEVQQKIKDQKRVARSVS